MSRTKQKLYEIIFETDTTARKLFDVVLLVIILISVVLVMLESVPGIRTDHQKLLRLLEWITTGIFTVEYILRVAIVRKPIRYIFSFYWIID